jgi:hypothetical protein
MQVRAVLEVPTVLSILNRKRYRVVVGIEVPRETTALLHQIHDDIGQRIGITMEARLTESLLDKRSKGGPLL